MSIKDRIRHYLHDIKCWFKRPLVRDNFEVLTDMVAGGLINYVLTMWIFGVSGKFALLTTIVFFVISYIRKLVIRRMFRKNEEKRK